MTEQKFALKQLESGAFTVVDADTGKELPGLLKTVVTSTPSGNMVDISMCLRDVRMYQPKTAASGGVVSGPYARIHLVGERAGEAIVPNPRR